jgi:hypothetical protein
MSEKLEYDKDGRGIVNGPKTFNAVARLLRAHHSVNLEMLVGYNRLDLYIAEGGMGVDYSGQLSPYSPFLFIGIRTPGRLSCVSKTGAITPAIISEWRYSSLDADGRAQVAGFFEGVRQAYMGMPAAGSSPKLGEGTRAILAGVLKVREAERVEADEDTGLPRLTLPEL